MKIFVILGMSYLSLTAYLILKRASDNLGYILDLGFLQIQRIHTIFEKQQWLAEISSYLTVPSNILNNIDLAAIQNKHELLTLVKQNMFLYAGH